MCKERPPGKMETVVLIMRCSTVVLCKYDIVRALLDYLRVVKPARLQGGCQGHIAMRKTLRRLRLGALDILDSTVPRAY